MENVEIVFETVRPLHPTLTAIDQQELAALIALAHRQRLPVIAW